VTKLTLLYGVAALQKTYGATQLSVGELADAVGALAELPAIPVPSLLLALPPPSSFALAQPHAPLHQRAHRWLSRWKRGCLS
jgi:hypothetical protein